MSTVILPDPARKRDRLYDAMKDADYGRVFTYQEISDIVGVDDIRANGNRQIIYSVDKRLLKTAQRCLANVVNEGYKIITPDEHLARMAWRQKRSRRQARMGKLTGEATDLNQISDPVARKAIQDQTTRLASIESQLAHHRKRMARTETVVSGQVEKTDAMDERLKRLEELLAERQRDDEPSNGLENSDQGDAA